MEAVTEARLCGGYSRLVEAVTEARLCGGYSRPVEALSTATLYELSLVAAINEQ